MILYTLSFDLGNNLGIALSVYNTEKNIFNIINSKTFNIQNYIKENNLIIDNISNRTSIKILAFFEIIDNYIKSLNTSIDIFVSEEIFIYPKRITAYKSLVIYMHKLEDYINFYYNKDLIKLSPKYIKRFFSPLKKGTANKKDMLIALQNNKAININSSINNLSEHEIDAIAVNYVCIMQLLKNTYLKRN